MYTINELKMMFPKIKGTNAVTGRIPMDFFEANEKAIRASMREHGYRAIYRGPRISNNNHRSNVPSMTRRCDATHVMIYHQN